MMVEKILNSIKEYLVENNITYPLALVGSATKSNDFNDFDFLMVVDNIDLARKLILNAFKKYNTRISDDAIRIDGYTNTTISIALYEKDKVDNIINNFMSGKKGIPEHRIWCLGYWIRESFIANLQKHIP